MSKFKVGRPKLTDPFVSKEERLRHKREGLKKWQKKNADRLREYYRNYSSNHRDKEKLKRERYAQKHPGRKTQLLKTWYRKNPERRRIYYYRRKSGSLNVPKEEIRKIDKWRSSWRHEFDVICYWCRQRTFSWKAQVDHIMPIKLGGKHVLSNLAVSCKPCNMLKRAKHPDAFRDLIRSKSS